MTATSEEVVPKEKASSTEGVMGGKPPLDLVLDALDEHIAQQSEMRASFHCPLHDDHNASGWITWGYDERNVEKYSIRCYGCDGDDGAWFSDFLRWMQGSAPAEPWRGKEPSSGKHARRGLRGTFVGRRHLFSYFYVDENGKCVGCKERWEYEYEVAPDSYRYRRMFRWSEDYPLRGRAAPLFRLPDVIRSLGAGETIYVVEGERDALTMLDLEMTATTGPNGAGSPWTKEQLETLRGAEVVVIADNDVPGREHARYLAKALEGIAESVHMKVPVDYNDVTEIHLAGLDVLDNLETLKPFVPYRRHIDPLTEKVLSLEPTMLEDAECRLMLYPGEIHWLYGRPGTYKSMLALRVALQCDARYLDFENGLAVTKERMEFMGAKPHRHNKFDFPQTREELQERLHEYLETVPQLVIIDGFSGFAGLLGVDADNNAEVQQLFSEYLYPLKNAGIAVLMLDHLPKEASHDDFPIGAQCKKSQSGVTILLKQVDDSVGVYVTKDRHYRLAARCEDSGSLKKYGWLEVTHEEGLLRIRVKPVLIAEIEGRKLIPREATLLKEIWNFIDQNPGATKSAIEQGVQGKNAHIRKALDVLIADGNVKQAQVGPALTHKTNKPVAVDWYARGDNQRSQEALMEDWVSSSQLATGDKTGIHRFISPEALREVLA